MVKSTRDYGNSLLCQSQKVPMNLQPEENIHSWSPNVVHPDIYSITFIWEGSGLLLHNIFQPPDLTFPSANACLVAVVTGSCQAKCHLSPCLCLWTHSACSSLKCLAACMAESFYPLHCGKGEWPAYILLFSRSLDHFSACVEGSLHHTDTTMLMKASRAT